MWRRISMVWLAVVAVGLFGCGGSEQTAQKPEAGGAEAQSGGGAKADDPSQVKEAVTAAVFEFLEAVRTGNDDQAAQMLTGLARKKTAESGLEVAPPGSDTAQFKVGEVKLLPNDRAQVTSTWSDLDEKSQRRADTITWMLRRQPEGWRIAGVMATVFAGEPPLLLNFEDPEEMLRKQELLQQEKNRRAQQAERPSTPEGPSGRPIRR